jgi:SOS-response transcriptional repressor LexA
MADFATQARPASTPRIKRRPGRKPKDSAPVIAPQTPDKPDPDHVLTWRQRKVLRAIRESVQKRGYPPSMREIGEAVGLTTTSSVSYQLSILQRKGYLHRDVGRARTMEVRLPDRPPVRPAGTVADRPPVEPGDAALSSRELITWLARRRAELGLSQAEVAQRMQASQAAVTRLESKRQEAQLSMLAGYAQALGLSLDFLLREKRAGEDPEDRGAEADPGRGLPARYPPTLSALGISVRLARLELITGRRACAR